MNARNAQLEQDMRNVVSEVEELLTVVGNEGGAGAREVKERAVRTLEVAKQRLNNIDTHVRSTARHAVEATDDERDAVRGCLERLGLLARVAA